MKNYLQTTNLINISDVDFNYNLRFDHMLNYLQDVTTLHSYDLKIDRESLIASSNAFWVLTKIKLVFNKLPKWNEETTIKTYPTTITPIRFFREYQLNTKSGANVLGKSEWCVLDGDTKTIRRSNTIVYPTEMEHLPPNPDIPDFIKLRETVTDNDFCFDYTVMNADIDCNRHTNNVVYAKLMLNSFTPTEYDSLNLKGLEINYINQSFHGDTISVYKKCVGDGYYIEGKLQDKTIFISKLYI